MYCVVMIAKRRLTVTRSFTLGAILLLLFVLLKLFSQDYPLDVIRIYQADALRALWSGSRPLPVSKKEGFRKGKQRKVFTPCKLYRLPREKQTTYNENRPPQAQCKRVQPVPGSCDVAKRLFHSSPPADCRIQSSVEICKLKKTKGRPEVECKKGQCDLTLSGAAVDAHTGELQWKRFTSPQTLEKWINNLLQPSRTKKHFGFCFIGCGGDWTDFDGKEIYVQNGEDLFTPFQAVQLLLLPPSVQSDSGSHSQLDINFNLIFVDSVSRQHFFRSLPETVGLFQNLARNTSTVTLLDFELVQSVRSRTFETLQALFAGEIDPSVKPFGVLELPPEPLKTEMLLKALKQKGYSTLWLEDLCCLWEWGISKDLLVYNKTFTQRETWKKMQQALKKASIDSLEVTYAMCRVLSENGVPDHFHGPDAVCFNGRHQHDYLLDYLLLYQNTLSKAGLPFFTFMETNVGHEDTGKRIQTLDKSFRDYLQYMATQENTLTIIMSDHGNSYGAYLEETMEGRMELFHPHLFMMVPKKLADHVGGKAMDALQQNQHRLISHLDLHYMLKSLAQNSQNKVAQKHKGFNVTEKGLLSPISAGRSCNHIPRIMPNLCICEDFDMPVDADAHLALFAHLAIGKMNNEIQHQFQRRALLSGTKPVQGFGHCQRLHLAAFTNIRKSFLGNTISLKMDLQVPLEEDLELYQDAQDLQSKADRMEIFFVAMQAQLDSRNISSNNVILQTFDRITPYSKFSVCADKTVALQLCLCDVNSTKGRESNPKLPTAEELGEFGLFLESEVFVAEGSQKCLVLVVKKNKHGGVFSVANVCKGYAFQIVFMLETVEMIVSDGMPREEKVLPGQELFLCMAVKSAPKADWNWSFTLHHQQLPL